MESRLAHQAKADLLEIMRHMTPEQRLNAFLEHCNLVMELYEAGSREDAGAGGVGRARAWKRDRVYFRGLQHFGVPSEWYVYPRSGHGWDEPGSMLDAYRRHVAWFDYWIHGKPYPDASKLGGYEA